MEQDLGQVLAGRSILKPVYQHKDGTFGPPIYVTPRQFTVVEGLLGYHTPALRESFDVRVFLAPTEDLRRQWKVQRDCTRRGYTTDQVLDELDRREPDSQSFIRPQQRFADIVVSFTVPDGRVDHEHLDAELTLREGLEHPDMSPLVDVSGQGMRLAESEHEQRLFIPGAIDPSAAGEVEEAIWDRMHFASHLRSERLGEFTIGTDLHRSHSLALVQVLILYHLVTARAAVALGGESGRADRDLGALHEHEAVGL
jgi:phosphoribulokinase